jgi:hypothetical protein
MKKIWLLILALFFTIIAFSQLSKGQIIIGGNGSLSIYKNSVDKTKTIIYQITPDAGMFIIDKLLVGLRIQYNHGILFDSDGVKFFKNSIYSGLPFVRYYFLQKSKPINIYADVGYMIGKSIAQQTGLPKDIVNQYGFSAMSGLAIFLNDKSSLEIFINYYRKNHVYPVSYEVYDDIILFGAGFHLHLRPLKRK